MIRSNNQQSEPPCTKPTVKAVVQSRPVGDYLVPDGVYRSNDSIIYIKTINKNESVPNFVYVFEDEIKDLDHVINTLVEKH